MCGQMFQLMKAITLYDFENAASLPAWGHTDDVVMGGLSASHFEFREQALVFTGTVSLENNGGFASAYLAEQRFDLQEYSGIRLRVRGDGKRYGFNLMTPVNDREQFHRFYFDTIADTWQDIEMPFGEFIPMRRGTVLPMSMRPNLKQVLRMGFIISGKQEGKFNLQVKQIAAYQ